MKWNKLLISGLLLSVIGSATVFASDALETFTGKRVSLSVNGTQASTAINIDGTTMVPLSAIQDSLQAMVKVNSTTGAVEVYKPNVHLSLFEVAKDSARPFGKVSVNGKYDFVVFAQVDSLPVPVHAFKVDIEDPSGKVIETKYKEYDNQEDIWYTTPVIRLDFNDTGKYMVKFYMKLDSDSDYALVAQKAIMSLKE